MIRFASLGSGSAGNALLVEHEATCLMLDCGFGLRDTVTRLLRLGRAPSDLAGILVTHEHGDHVNGVFRLARKFGLPVWMTHGTWTACREVDTELDLRIIDSHRSFSIGQLEIQPFPVPHDAREPVQFVFSIGKTRLGVLTDIGEPTLHVCEMLSAVLDWFWNSIMMQVCWNGRLIRYRLSGVFRGDMATWKIPPQPLCLAELIVLPCNIWLPPI